MDDWGSLWDAACSGQSLCHRSDRQETKEEKLQIACYTFVFALSRQLQSSSYEVHQIWMTK